MKTKKEVLKEEKKEIKKEEGKVTLRAKVNTYAPDGEIITAGTEIKVSREFSNRVKAEGNNTFEEVN